jgi:hypothetical protein
VKYGEASTEGTIDISASGARAAATIASLTFRAGGSSFKSFKVTSGALSIDSNNATCNGLQISGLDGRALVNGSFAFADQSGDLHADWNALQPVPTVSSSGSIDTKLRSNWPDQRVVNVEIRTNGSAAANTYKSVIALNGSGKSWDAANWTLTAPTLQWSGKQSPHRPLRHHAGPTHARRHQFARNQHARRRRGSHVRSQKILRSQLQLVALSAGAELGHS